LGSVIAERLDQTVVELLDSASDVSAASRASYVRRWRMWEAFAVFHGVSALPADPEHVAAFVVGRFLAGVGVQALSANLSSVRWFHKRADVPVDVTAGARGVLNLLAKSQPATVSPAPVLSVGALLAMAWLGPSLGVGFSSKVIRFCLPSVKPRQLMGVLRRDVSFGPDDSYVDVVLPPVAPSYTHGSIAAASVRLVADEGWVGCPVRAFRLLVNNAGSDSLFSLKLHSDFRTFHPLTSPDGIHARLAVRDAAIVCVGYGGALRMEELSRARVEDLDALDGAYRLRIPVSKTSRGGDQAVVLLERRDRLDPVGALDRWLAVRGDHDGPLFVALHHRGSQRGDLSMPADSIRSVIGDLAARAGLPAGVSGHSLRRSWATHCYLANPNDLASVSLQLRHASTQMTVRYIEDLRVESMNGLDMLDPNTVTLGVGGQFRPTKNAGFGSASLTDLIGQVRELQRTATHPSTGKSSESLWAGWVRFADTHGWPVLPATSEGLGLLVAARAHDQISPGVIRAQITQVVRRHINGGHDGDGLRDLADDLVAAYGRTDRVSRRKPTAIFGEAELRSIVRDAPAGFGGIRDRVILCLGFNGAMTASELSHARLEHIEATTWGCILHLQTNGNLNETVVLLARRSDELDPIAAIAAIIKLLDRWRVRC
jgi:integrase